MAVNRLVTQIYGQRMWMETWGHVVLRIKEDV